MASSSIFFHLFSLMSIFYLLTPCYCFYSKQLFNHSASITGWAPAQATWYGPPDGAGSDGGACGFAGEVEKPPLNKMIAAGGPSLFESGKGCGACYQVSCQGNPACSGNPVTVTITDSCPGGPCASDPVHFDLSWVAFGALAKPGQADQLRNAGSIPVQYNKVQCNYPGFHVAFRVDSGANPNAFAVVVEFVGGDGDIGSMDLQQSGSGAWQPMQQSWGAIWHLDSGSPLNAPYSIRFTTVESNKQVVASNVIPVGWTAGATYRSIVG